MTTQKMKKYQELVEKTFEMDDDLIKQQKELLVKYQLHVHTPTGPNPILQEFINMSPEQYAGIKDVDVLEKYQKAVINWRLYITELINLTEIYAMRIKRQLTSMLRFKRVKIYNNRALAIKLNTDKSMIDHIYTQEDDPECVAIQEMDEKYSIAYSNQILLKGFDKETESIYFMLESKIKRVDSVKTQAMHSRKRPDF